ncbi:hypothetical protein J7337_008167 [Fusarium musae]|uniref:non-specific serine/threonine protein kinase n=1 Tax=Fusarium musae TaxID=1042133 RepID=A0A9P8DD50_9HYPO|nr:hypothetical protein J7337_008167 [Fusarium musae]KAG9499708.1 hypothetical protein J7337_008167 [Fusarium musae]
MHTDQAVFYLAPANEFALDIVRHPENSNRRCQDPRDPKKLCLRIGLDQESKSPPYLVSFGRRDHNDVILDKYFPRTDQCYFEFNKESGELLLHDISKAGDTQLAEIGRIIEKDETRSIEIEKKSGSFEITKAPRQCVVLLGPDLYQDRIEWLFKIRDAEFLLIPGPTQLIEEKLAFARNTNNDEALERTLQARRTLDLQPDGSLALELRSTYFRALPKQENDKLIRFRKLKLLGSGGQAEVYKVVDMYTGTHYACKIINVGKMAAEWKIATGKDYRIRLKREVEMLRNLTHPHIVPYTHTQNSEFSPYFEIFMPIYKGSLLDLLREPREQGLEELQAIVCQMLYQMFQALDFIHSRDPPIIHRDIKPQNILYHDDNFFLTDFGIAKAVDTSKTFIGSRPYMAPEVRENRQHTPKIDIWALGVTVVKCLEKHEDFEEQAKGEQWYEYLQTSLNRHGFSFVSMVSVKTDGRPTAHDLLQHWSTDASLGSAVPSLSPGTTARGSAPPILTDRAQTVSTTLAQPMTHDESLQLLQPKAAVIASLSVPPSPPAQPGTGHGESGKSARPGKRKRSLHDGDTLSHSSLLPVPKRFCKA